MKKSELNKIEKSKTITHCYIKKGAYYRPYACGYTDYKYMAGVYTKEEAIKHAENCNELTLIPIEKRQHNSMILDEVKELLTRIIL